MYVCLCIFTVTVVVLQNYPLRLDSKLRIQLDKIKMVHHVNLCYKEIVRKIV